MMQAIKQILSILPKTFFNLNQLANLLLFN